MNRDEIFEIIDLKDMTRAEQREFCLQIIYQKASEKKFSKIMSFLTDLAVWLQTRDLTDKQINALQKIINYNKLAYHRVGYLKRSKEDLSRSIDRTGFIQTPSIKRKNRDDSFQYKVEKVKKLFIETFGITDITSIEVLEQLEELCEQFTYGEIEETFLKFRKRRLGKTLTWIQKILRETKNILSKDKEYGENRINIGKDGNNKQNAAWGGKRVHAKKM